MNTLDRRGRETREQRIRSVEQRSGTGCVDEEACTAILRGGRPAVLARVDRIGTRITRSDNGRDPRWGLVTENILMCTRSHRKNTHATTPLPGLAWHLLCRGSHVHRNAFNDRRDKLSFDSYGRFFAKLALFSTTALFSATIISSWWSKSWSIGDRP